MDKKIEQYGKAFKGFESLLFSMKSVKEIQKLLRNVNTEISEMLDRVDRQSPKEHLENIARTIKLNIAEEKDEFQQIEEANKIIQECQKKKKKFKKIDVLKKEVKLIIRLSESMKWIDIATYFTNTYKKDLQESGLADFSASEVFNIVKKHKLNEEKAIA